MKWYNPLLSFMATAFLLSCSNGLEEGSSVNTAAPATAPAVNVAPPPVQQPQQTAAKGSVALNPPHGQPGHRCDIKVGEPLTTPAPATTITTQPPVTTTPVVAPPAQGSAASGKNPPHGQPGHRCDIAVGAPLNSKPAQ